MTTKSSLPTKALKSVKRRLSLKFSPRVIKPMRRRIEKVLKSPCLRKWRNFCACYRYTMRKLTKLEMATLATVAYVNSHSKKA